MLRSSGLFINRNKSVNIRIDLCFQASLLIFPAIGFQNAVKAFSCLLQIVRNLNRAHVIRTDISPAADLRHHLIQTAQTHKSQMTVSGFCRKLHFAVPVRKHFLISAGQ